MKCKFMLTLVAFLLLGSSVVSQADEPWVDWNVRMQIRFAEEIASPLTNFPLLVVLDETIEDFAYEDFAYPAYGADLRFANEDEDALLDYEIEDWNTNGASYVWVKVPLIESTNDFIYAYWGRSDVSHAPSTTNGAVWSEDFAGVWHLNDTNVLDSTANENHPTSVTALTATNGMINGAMAFNGLASGDSRVVIPNDSSLNPAHLTLSAWVKPLGQGTHADGAHIFSKGRGGNPWASYTLRYRDDQNRLYATITTGTTQHTLTESATVSLGQFYHIAATYDGSTFRLYRDGIERASMAVSGDVNYSIADNNLHFGGWNYSTFHRRFNGVTDNLQISSVPRSADWLYATWLNQASNHVFLAFEDAGAISDGLAVSARPASGISDTSATLRGRVLATGEAENPEVHVAWGMSDGGTNALTDWHESIFLGTDWGAGNNFSTPLTGLTSGETYYYRTYVTNSTGEAWSQDVRSFTTLLLPAIDNLGADWVRRHEASVQGEVTSDGGEPSDVRVELWADASAVTSSVPLGVQSVGPVSTVVEGLEADTLYHFRFVASNNAGVVFSAPDSFTTWSSDPVTWYVAPDGPDGVGTNWATAMVSLHDAMDRVLDGDAVLLTNAVHILTESIAITNGITISGPWGREQTTIKRDTSLALFRLFSMTHSDAVIEGVTLTQGRSGALNGGGIHMTDGLVRDVIVDDCRTDNQRSGGGISIEGGRLESSIITNCWANQAGGILLSGSGVVSNVVVTGNSTVHGGGGVIVNSANALLTHSVIENNQNSHNTGGGGLFLSNGTVQNSLIHGNSQTFLNNTGGGMRQTGGSLVNCTVVGNSVLLGADGGGGVSHTGGAITNTIMFGNHRGSLSDDLRTTVPANIHYSSAPELDDTQNNNLNSSPEFIDLAGGDFRLSPESPAIDSGIAVGGIAVDLNGVTRPQDGSGDSVAAWDRGAYEALPVNQGPLRVGFRATPRSGMEPLTVSFEAFVTGTNQVLLTYYWDLNGDGTLDRVGMEYDAFTYDYGSGGQYDVSLTVSNYAGEGAVRAKPAYITVSAAELYVSSQGYHISPFDTWENAATNLAAAFALASDGAVITVSNGVYEAVNLQLDFEVELVSLNGPEVTTLDAGGAGRVMQISHPLARVEGFTLRGGNSGFGGAVNMSDGTIRNCHIRNSTAGHLSNGGGVYMSGGRLLDSTVSHNTGSQSAGGVMLLGSGLASNLVVMANSSIHGGGGVLINSADALLTHSLILNNTNSNNSGGAGVYFGTSGGTVRNSLIRGNRQSGVATGSHGGGVRLTGGLLINCTVVSNSVPEAALGGGVYHTAGVITNTIVFGNLRGTFDDDLNSTMPGNIGYSCAPELDDGVNGNIDASPGFIDFAAGNFRLEWGSPAIDAGIHQAWMTNATDMDGNPRVSGKHVDMGAYEYQHPKRGTMFIFR